MSKKTFFAFFISLVFFYLIYGLFLIQYDFNIFNKTLSTEHPRHFYDYSGITHTHSNHSSGSGDLETIIEEAQISGLDFIYITDLNNFSPDIKKEGYYEKLMLFLDGEYNYLDSKLLHYHRKHSDELQGPGRTQIAFSDLLGRKNKDPHEGILVLSHPFKSNYKWDGPYPEGLDGLEIVNFKTLWQDSWQKSKASFIWSLLIYPFNPSLAFIRLFKFPSQNLKLWNELSLKRPTVGFLGTDAEAKIFLGSQNIIKFPSYNSIFSLAKTHVLLHSELTGIFKNDKSKVQAAIKKGQFYISLDAISSPKGFEVYLKTPQGQILPPGAEIPWQAQLELIVNLPSQPKVPVNIFFLRNGELIMKANSKTSSMVLHEPGVYRVLVRARLDFPLFEKNKWVDWILSNHFYVNDFHNK